MNDDNETTSAVACIGCHRYFCPDGGFLERHFERDHWTGLLW